MNQKTKVLSSEWKQNGAWLTLILLIYTVLYYSSLESIVAIWLRSDTYAHGFIILPISLWLIWRKRSELVSSVPTFNYLGIPILAGLGLLWLLASYIGVLVIEQLAVVMMIPVLTFSLLGWNTIKVIAFPLMFLLFAVPMGEELTPLLIDFTADFTVALIKLVGIPIYREGNFLELPTGNWSVVAACSGVRYLIASVTLGVLYAYLNYHSLLKRAIFIGLSFIVPIIANGLRAFMIVMIGHLSDMKLATGVDHLIYGWLFFGIVIGIMFYIGSFWADQDADDGHIAKYDVRERKAAGFSGHSIAVLTLLILAVWPVKLNLEGSDIDYSNVPNINAIKADGWESRPINAFDWKPAYQGLDQQYASAFINSAGEKVVLFIGYYAEQRQDAELGNFTNVLVSEKDNNWRVGSQQQKVSLFEDGMLSPLSELVSRNQRLVATHFFYADSQIITNKYQTKLVQAKARMLGGRNDGAVIAISTIQLDNREASVELLREFTIDALPTIKAAIDSLGNRP